MKEEKDKYYFAKRNNCLYQEELDYFYYSFSEQERKDMIKEVEEKREQLDDEAKFYFDYFGAEVIAIAFCPTYEDITHEDLGKFYIERSKYKEEAERFFKKEEAKQVYDILEYVPSTTQRGEYIVTGENSCVLSSIVKAGAFKDLEHYKERELEELIETYWEDKETFLTPEKVNEVSIARNGISFKEYIFCEEYLKSGRITKTSEILGIGRTTCYDYLKKKEVKDYLQKRTEEIKTESDSLFKQGFYDCFEELQKIVKEKHTDDNAKIKAIDIYLKHYENSLYKQEQI